MRSKWLALAIVLLFAGSLGVACNNRKNETIANQKGIEEQLKLAGLNDVTIHLDRDTRVARLDGSVKDQDERAHAERIVHETAPHYNLADNISVQPENASEQQPSGSNGQTAGR